MKLDHEISRLAVVAWARSMPPDRRTGDSPQQDAATAEGL